MSRTMPNDESRSRASSVLRFTVTTALVLAPMAGCGTPTRMTNPGPEEIVQPNTNLQPEPTPEVAAEVDAGIDTGEEADAGLYPRPSGANPDPNGLGAVPRRFNANPVPHHEPVES